MKKHQKNYLQFLAEFGPENFKRPLLTHCNGITTGWKRAGKVSRDNTKSKECLSEEYLAKNMRLSLLYCFCLNWESKVEKLPHNLKRLLEQREWMQANVQLKASEEIVISSGDLEDLSR